MADEVRDLDDERLQAHTKARITPEVVEWVKRLRLSSAVAPEVANNSARFCYLLGIEAGKAEFIKKLEELLRSTLDPEL